MRYGRWSNVELPHFKRPKLPHVTAHAVATIIKYVALSGGLIGVFLLFKIQATTNLLAQQAKATSEQNQIIARQNGKHIDCIADLFIKFTQDQKPIAKADLDKCKFTEAKTKAAGNKSATSVNIGAVDFSSPISTTAPARQKTPSSNSNTNLPAAQNENPTNTTQTPPAPEPIRVLGIPVCAPDPFGLINNGLCVTSGTK